MDEGPTGLWLSDHLEFQGLSAVHSDEGYSLGAKFCARDSVLAEPWDPVPRLVSLKEAQTSHFESFPDIYVHQGGKPVRQGENLHVSYISHISTP